MEENKFYFEEDEEVKKKKKKRKKKKKKKPVRNEVEMLELEEGEEKEPNYNKIFFALLAFGIIIVAAGAIYAQSQNSKRDWDSMASNKVDVTENLYQEVDSESVIINAEQVADENAIKSIVLIKNSKELTDSYRFEMYSDGKDLYFSCYYPTNDGNIVLTGEKVDKTRMTDVINTINRFTVAKKIDAYRENGIAIEKDNEDDSQSLQITWFDGDSVDVGFPNGAGKAVESYFKNLASWINNSGN